MMVTWLGTMSEASRIRNNVLLPGKRKRAKA